MFSIRRKFESSTTCHQYTPHFALVKGHRKKTPFISSGAVRWLEDWIEEKLCAILWKDGVLYDLNNHLVDGKGWVLWSAKHINNKGQIAGEGTFQGDRRSFLLDPVE